MIKPMLVATTPTLHEPPAEQSSRRVPTASRVDRLAAVALLLGVLGVGYRIWLLLHHTPVTNSDEATMSLAALHIAQGRDFPVFFYG